MQQQGRLNNGKEIDYALGLTIGKYRNVKMVEHGGSDAGYRSFVVWFPEEHLGIAPAQQLSQCGRGRNRLARGRLLPA